MAGEFDVSKLEVGAWLQPPDELEVSKAELGAWLEPPNELEVAKVEVGAWLERLDEIEIAKVELGAWLEIANEIEVSRLEIGAWVEPSGGVPPDPGSRPLFISGRVALLSQYANSPVILALVDNWSAAIDRLADFDAFFEAVWNVDTATGFGLDIWGRIVGVNRMLYVPDSDYLGFSQSSDAQPFDQGIFYGAGTFTANYRLTDSAYRKLILAKAALNITNGSIPAINAILRALFPGYGNVYVRDNADMTMVFVFGATLTKVDYVIVSQSGVLPKPVGVSVTVEQL